MPMLDSETSRRKFLIGVIAFTGLAGCAQGPSAGRLSNAFAQPSDQLDQSARDATVRMARLLYPHDAVSDDVYAEVLDQVLTSVANDDAFTEAINAAEETLNAQQAANFIDLDEEAQIVALQAIEQMDFFTTIQAAVRSRLYYHPAVWELLGYEGPSYQQGGYLNRGAGEINWLPEVE
jgi:hypothetical protein